MVFPSFSISGPYFLGSFGLSKLNSCQGVTHFRNVNGAGMTDKEPGNCGNSKNA